MEENGSLIQIKEHSYFIVYTICPVCHDKGYILEKSYWIHLDEDCNGKIYVGDDANYYCSKCGEYCSVSNAIILSLCCKKVPRNGLSFQSNLTDSHKTTIVDVISFVGGMVTETGIFWLTVFLKNIESQYSKV
jgi:hypothetical protein